MNKYLAFQLELNAATQRAAGIAISQFGAEDIYSFALYTSGEYNYVFASLSTLQGLEEVAGRYMTEETWKASWGDLYRAMKGLKWSPCDSPHHLALYEEFASVNILLDAIWESSAAESDEDFNNIADSIHKAFVEALQNVRASDIFSSDVTVNILQGDQSDEERLSNAALLNEPALVARLRNDQLYS